MEPLLEITKETRFFLLDHDGDCSQGMYRRFVGVTLDGEKAITFWTYPDFNHVTDVVNEILEAKYQEYSILKGDGVEFGEILDEIKSRKKVV